MKYSLAVLLLKLADQSDTPFEPEYAIRLFTSAGQGTRNLVDYYLDMSHGEADLSESKVFGWLDVPHTAEEISHYYRKVKDDETKRLNDENNGLLDEQKLPSEKIEKMAEEAAEKMRRSKIKDWTREAAAAVKPHPIDLSSYYSFVAVFSSPIAYFANRQGVAISHNPSNEERNSVELTGVAHEVGHALGLQHSRREGSDTQYGDPWDIMSAYWVLYNHADSTNVDPNRPYHTYGPGLNVVNMHLQGWLDMSRVYQFTGGATNVTLRPLHRRDLPGYLAARVGQLWVEFRMAELWDSAIGEQVVLLHTCGVNEAGFPCSNIVVVNNSGGIFKPVKDPRALHNGEVFQIGNHLDIDSEFLRIAVEINAEGREATITISYRRARRIEPALPFGAVTSDGGGLIWTPGRGWVRVPPRSPLYAILEQIAEIEQLQALSAERIQQTTINALTTQRLVRARDDVNRIIATRQEAKVPAIPLPTKHKQG